MKMVLFGKINLDYMHSDEDVRMVEIKKKSRYRFRNVRFDLSVVFFFILIFFYGCDFNTGFDSTEKIIKPSANKNKLTLIVYMAADNDLESYALENLNAMEKIRFKKMKVIVLLDRSEGYDETNGDWTDTRLFEVVHDKTDSSQIVSKRLSSRQLGLSLNTETELDMGNYIVLQKLIDFAKAEYPAEKYALLMWGHGTGWRGSCNEDREGGNYRAVAIDDKTHSYISVKELGLALKNQGLSVIGFDTCFGAVIENLYELKDSAEYTVASPGVTPSCGWDYKDLLEALNNSDYSSESIADAMAHSSSVKITIIKNSQLSALEQSFDIFSKQLADRITDAGSQKSTLETVLQTKSYCYSSYPCELYIDIFDLAARVNVEESSNLMSLINSMARTRNSVSAEIAVFFIPKNGLLTIDANHSSDYVKSDENTNQCSFIKDNNWWVPTKNGNSGSLLDKLFYTSF